jgi:16S rRNA (cytosine1402-N4)-methyltransferase
MTEAVGVHDPVMLSEILECFDLKPGQVVVDATLGHGGHSRKMLEKISPGGVLVGFDWDEAMMEIAKKRLAEYGQSKVHYVRDNFKTIGLKMVELGLQADAILIDLGLNSNQIDDPNRGISFRTEGPLDMRMDRSSGEPASAILNRISPQAIEDALLEYGDERWARAIAKVIVAKRKERPLKTTADLVDCVLAAIPARARDKRIHPATRTFQAIRILTNHELEGLATAISDAAQALNLRGKLLILSYHSGEDRIVKQSFARLAGSEFEPIFKKPLVPTDGEIRQNSRSRSAKLRGLIRITKQEAHHEHSN